MGGGWVRQRGSQADARAIKATGECDECGQSVKPPLKSQYYLQDILWCLRGLYRDKMGRRGPGGGEEERGEVEEEEEGSATACCPFSTPQYHHNYHITHYLPATLTIIVPFLPFSFPPLLLLLLSLVLGPYLLIR